MKILSLGLCASMLLLASGAAAEIVPGDFFVTEQHIGQPPADDGSIVNIWGGGDVTSVPRFATGMNVPQGLCIGPGGDLYVTEFRDGTILVVTEGGDVSAAVVHASGLSSPHGLLCSDTQILVAEQTTGEVTDATLGGDLSAAPPFAEVGFDVVGLMRSSAGRIYLSVNEPAKIYDITDGGDLTGLPAFAEGGVPDDDGLAGMAEWNGALLVADLHNDTVIDFTGGGLLDDVILSLNGVEQLEAVPGLGLFALRTNNEVVEISTGVVLPFATGLSGVGFSGGLLYVPGCGDGLVQVDEGCDDGNTVDGDDCRNDCTFCGDGIIDPAEECDDGNTIEGDGCSVACLTELCGDGVTQPSEECDDANTSNGDGCDATCLLEVCGNGILQLGEECDDANTVAGDGCRSDCTAEVCGDGLLDPGEQCDDGNTLEGDTCTGDCMNAVPEPAAPLALLVGSLVLGVARRARRGRFPLSA